MRWPWHRPRSGNWNHQHAGERKNCWPCADQGIGLGRRRWKQWWKVSFDALYHLNRPGLLLVDGVVYIAFGAVGDIPPFHGWVMGYNGAALQQVSVFNASPDG